MDKEAVTILHAVPGRIRLTLNETKEPDLDTFLDIHGVEEVTFCRITKSLLIIYDEDAISEKALLSEIRKRLPDTILLKTRQTQQASLLTKAVVDITRKMNTSVETKTKGCVDVMFLAPSVFVLLGIRELLRNPLKPKWYDFFWWSLNMFYWQSKGIGESIAMPVEGSKYDPKTLRKM